MNAVVKQSDVSLTTDMWTSRTGDGYISLTCHCILPDFEIFQKNLLTRHLLGTHDHGHITAALQSGAEEWGIDLSSVTAFITDNGSNIIKSVESDLCILHIPCV